MSFFGSLGTAVQGINAQATAIGHISDNVANATTVGYKAVNTSFSDLVFNKVLGDSSVIDSNRNMGVMAYADFANRAQGTILHDSNPSAIAVSGNGFIPVSRPTGIDAVTGEPTGLEAAPYFTRLGDFHMDNSNRLVNSAGYYLRAAAVGGRTPQDFVVDTDPIPAVPTSVVNYSVNLPASALSGKVITTGIGVVDAESEEQNFQLIWTKTGTDTWNLTFNTEEATPNTFGPVAVTFNNGTLASMTSGDPNVTASTGGSGAAATLDLSVDYGSGPQDITVNLGTFGAGFDVTATSGITQYASETREASNINITQNGLLGGDFDYVSFQDDGNIMYNYSNGRSQIGGQLLLGNFPEPDRLDRVDGTAFLATGVEGSGAVVYGRPGNPQGSGVGKLVPGALEQSTVDVAEEMTKLVLAQQAYSMNGQVISASDSMLSRLIDMKR